MSYTKAALTGALTDPCPVCHLKPKLGIDTSGMHAEPTDGAYTICFGCGLVQVIRDGMRCALTEAEADWVFEKPELIISLVAISKMRAINPMRTGEIVREQ